MKIISHKKENLLEYGVMRATNVHTIHVRVSDVDSRAREMIEIISNKSWLNKLDSIDKVSFEELANKTIKKLVEDIFLKIDGIVTGEFGEYLVSVSAQEVLCRCCKHKHVPLAELWNKKVIGNPGFDFHTEAETNFIAFGEAKYSGSTSPHGEALSQVVDFIDNKKDIEDLHILRKFVSSDAVQNAIRGTKAYVAAFSLNCKNPLAIFKNAITSAAFSKLLKHKELYLIGVEVYADKDQ